MTCQQSGWSRVEYLESLGFEVSEAENADHAFEAWDHMPPDLMFANWYMRGAPWLIGLIHENPAGIVQSLIVFLVENEPLEISRVLRGGADAFLLKPFNRETLEAKLDEIGALSGQTADVSLSESDHVSVVEAAIPEDTDHTVEAERDPPRRKSRVISVVE